MDMFCKEAGNHVRDAVNSACEVVRSVVLANSYLEDSQIEAE